MPSFFDRLFGMRRHAGEYPCVYDYFCDGILLEKWAADCFGFKGGALEFGPFVSLLGPLGRAGA